MNWWVSDILESGGGYVALFSWAFWVIFSICLHELAHGWAAIWQGDDTPIITGHMTIDPVVHMGKASLIAFAIIGVAWGMMPVNPAKFRMRGLGDALVSAAGPAMNLLLAFGALTALAVVDTFAPTGPSIFIDNLSTFLWVGGYLNIVLAILNLMPAPPLDGSRILAGLSRSAANFYRTFEERGLGYIGVIFIFLFAGEFIFEAAVTVAEAWLRLALNILS